VGEWCRWSCGTTREFHWAFIVENAQHNMYIVDVFVAFFLLRNYVFLVSGCSWGSWCRWSCGTRGSSTGHSFVKRLIITWYIVSIHVAMFRNFVFPVSECSRVGTTSRGENGAVGIVDTVGVPLRIHL